MIPPPEWIPSNPEYHGTLTHWSSSMLKAFREAPALAYELFVAGTLKREKPTPAMVIGSAVNVLLLEPHRLATYVHVADCKARTAKEYKNACEMRPHQLVLTETEWAEAEAVAGSILRPRTKAAEVARELLTNPDGYSEYAFKWDDPSGVPCKLMVDRLISLGGRPVIPELKTTNDPTPEAFKQHFCRMEYHCQAAFNRRGVQIRLGGQLPGFFVVAVRNEPPYDVFVYEADEELLDDGRLQVETDLAALAKCIQGAPWESPEESLSTGLIPKLSLPGWARRERSPVITIADPF